MPLSRRELCFTNVQLYAILRKYQHRAHDAAASIWRQCTRSNDDELLRMFNVEFHFENNNNNNRSKHRTPNAQIMNENRRKITS